MGGLSLWHWVIVGVVVLLLFGKGRISDVMGDLAKGITSFKRGLKDDETEAANRPAEAARISAQPAAPVDPVVEPVREDRPAS